MALRHWGCYVFDFCSSGSFWAISDMPLAWLLNRRIKIHGAVYFDERISKTFISWNENGKVHNFTALWKSSFNLTKVVSRQLRPNHLRPFIWDHFIWDHIHLRPRHLRPLHLRPHSYETCSFETTFIWDHIHLRPVHLRSYLFEPIFIWDHILFRPHSF